jgi:hypothetical protein
LGFLAQDGPWARARRSIDSTVGAK